MAASFAFLRDVRPYKTAWRVQVKVLHSWRQYTSMTAETLELIVSDDKGCKIHASVKKDLVNHYVNNLPVGDWRFIENFQLTHASGQFRRTNHLYKMAFINGTVVTMSDPVSDSNFLSLAKFSKIQSGDLNPSMLIDVMGQIVNIGEIETIEANNKPTTKIDFELRDEMDDIMACTLWGAFASQVYRACAESDGFMVVCVLKFAKIKTYNGNKSEGKARLMCTIYAIDTDWAWYYFSCCNCNKKVTPIHQGSSANSTTKAKPKLWCDVCKIVVTRVVANIAQDIIGAHAYVVLGDSFNEIENHDDVPDQIKGLVGKTFLFLLTVGKENIWGGKDSYKVSKVLQMNGLITEEMSEESLDMVNPAAIVSGDQLLLTYSQETNTTRKHRIFQQLI
ncbi:replication factor A protein 1 [Capsella rubella]|uniref:replication factor A protein 1 n=1 Tax=Capsella rubella TaxID=81985 RepID=UPI000CD54DC2|nr:replication factor A protein 1 [Capsella rubella]